MANLFTFQVPVAGGSQVILHRARHTSFCKMPHLSAAGLFLGGGVCGGGGSDCL